MRPDPDANPYPLVLATLIGALWLRLLALPDTLAPFNPDWVMLVLIYWSLALPERLGVIFAWVTGLWVDATTASLLGQHALVYAVAAFVCVRFHTRLRLFPLAQQMLLVLAFLLAAQIAVFGFELLQGRQALPWTYWLPALTGTLAWPLVLTVCRHLKRRYLG